MAEKIIYTDTMEETAKIFGAFDCNAKQIEEHFGVTIRNRDTEKAGGDAVIISGSDEDDVALAASVLSSLKRIAAVNGDISEQNVSYVISAVCDGESEELQALDNCICLSNKGKPIRPKTIGQKKYVRAITDNTIVFDVGPAGTGKTFLAVAMATAALKKKQISRIILTRPAVEAGESLGFLPGDLQNKIDPYLRPLYDALYEMLGAESYQKYVEKGVIEIAPLAYMRGRTLDDAFIILDEAQNTTAEQMKMFLTRLGFNSKAVITGDITQIDLPRGKRSGLKEAVKILEGIEDIAVHRFTEKDVVRHKLVQKIIAAYEKHEKAREGEKNGKDRFRISK